MSFSHIAKLTDYLYISGAAAVTPSNVREFGITCVVNLTLDVKPLNVPALETYQIRLDDTPNSKLCTYFDKLADKIHAVKNKGQCVLAVSWEVSVAC